MPYTAPLKPSLSAQHIEYSEPASEARPERPGLVRSASARLHNSRSYSSTSYVRRHRRSPSICKSTGLSTEPALRLSPIIDPHASLRQSPPPLNNAAIPPGAVISPPESAPNSSDEESPYCSGEGIKLEELEAAVRSIEQRRESSPERSGPETTSPDTGSAEKMAPAEQLGSEAQPSSSITSPPPQIKPNLLRLSKQARKIAHSRSSTETAIDDLKREEALTSSPDDSDAEATPKPPMVRKKSGELVRPALRPPSARRRPSSMPGTPVYAKAVHFDSQLEHIRHFLQLDRPLAVSAETSPVDTHDEDEEFPFGHQEKRNPGWEWELRLSNFPKDMSSRTQAVRLEKLFLSAEKNVLIGSVAVANLAFHKHVAARFTFDYWRTVSEVGAVYYHDVRRKHAHDGYDRFSFDIKLDDQANLENKTMFVCVRYNVNGEEFWDNNNGMNFQVDFSKSPKAAPGKSSHGSRPPLPRSRTFNSSHTSRPHSMPPSFDDLEELTKNVPFSNPFKITKGPPLNRSSDDIDTVGPPKRRENLPSQAFGNRYDFGASLTAAMRTKPPVDRTTLTARARFEQAPEPSTGSSAAKGLKPMGRTSPVSDGARKVDTKPSLLVSSKPCLESSGYKELVDKYCFFGSPKSSEQRPSVASNPKSLEPPRHTPPAMSPPLSPRSPAPIKAPAIEAPAKARSATTSPAPAPQSPRTSPRPSSAPMSFRYSYQQSLQNGFLNDPQSSPVIRGDYDASFLEMSSAVDSYSIPCLADYAYPACVGAL